MYKSEKSNADMKIVIYLLAGGLERWFNLTVVNLQVTTLEQDDIFAL